MPDFVIPIVTVALVFAISLFWPHVRKHGQAVLSPLRRSWKYLWPPLAIAGVIWGFWRGIRPAMSSFLRREDSTDILIGAAFLLACLIIVCCAAWRLRKVLKTAFIFLICGGAGFLLGATMGAGFFGFGYVAIAGLCGMLFGGLFALAITIANAKE